VRCPAPVAFGAVAAAGCSGIDSSRVGAHAASVTSTQNFLAGDPDDGTCSYPKIPVTITYAGSHFKALAPAAVLPVLDFQCMLLAAVGSMLLAAAA